MDFNNLPKQQRTMILQEKISAYRAQQYSTEVDYKVADMLGDMQAKENAQNVIKRLVQVITILEQMLADVQKETK